jgi:hypothetical protein
MGPVDIRLEYLYQGENAQAKALAAMRKTFRKEQRNQIALCKKIIKKMYHIPNVYYCWSRNTPFREISKKYLNSK